MMDSVTERLSLTGSVLAMQAMEVKPPCTAARDAAFDRFLVLLARFAQMGVHVDKARGDDQSPGVDDRACRRFS